MTQSKTQKIIKDTNGNEVVMIRIDKTLKETMEELPSSRWSADYWHPKYEILLKELGKYKFLSAFKDLLTSGFRGTLKFVKGGIPALKVRNILDTGIDLFDIDHLEENSPADTDSKAVKFGDIIINRSGTGSIGRMSIFIKNFKVLITGDVYLLRVKNCNPFYVTIFLKTKYGKEQIHRFETGVSGQTKIDLEEILNIRISLLSDSVQKNIEVKYKEMSEYHDKAMQSKKSGNEAEYKKNIETAEKMLKDLIARTEAVIRGERDDVI